MAGHLCSLALAAACALALAGAARAQTAAYEAKQAECQRLNAEMQDLNHRAQGLRDDEMKVLIEADNATKTADKIRGLDRWAVSIARQKAQSDLARLQEERDEMDRGAAISPRDAQIIKVKALIDALKDAELRFDDKEMTGGLLGSDKNALDTRAARLREAAARLSEKADALVQQAKARQREHEACLAELQRLQRTAIDLARDDDQYAFAEPGDDDDTSYVEPAGYDGPMSDAQPPGPRIRPSRLRGARPDRWTRDTGYAEPRGSRDRADRGDRTGRRDRTDRPDRGERGHGKERRERGHKAGGGGAQSCHANPVTGAQHCSPG
jgi:hypothetical protein